MPYAVMVHQLCSVSQHHRLGMFVCLFYMLSNLSVLFINDILWGLLLDARLDSISAVFGMCEHCLGTYGAQW